MTSLSSYGAFTSHRRSEGPIFLGRLQNFLSEMAVKWSKRRGYRQTISELQALSDHELDDIGISRGQIEMMAYQSTYEQG